MLQPHDQGCLPALLSPPSSLWSQEWHQHASPVIISGVNLCYLLHRFEIYRPYVLLLASEVGSVVEAAGARWTRIR